MTLTSTSSRHSTLDPVFGILVVLGAAGAGVMSSLKPTLAVVLVLGGVFLAAASRLPVLIAVLAVPAAFGAFDLGLGGGVGVSDAALIVAALLALPALPRTDARGRTTPIMRLLALYLGLLLPSLVANATGAALVEWVHRIVLVGCALVVGAWLRVEGRTGTALRLLTASASVVAVVAVVDAVRSGFEPAYPLIFHKNYAGALLALTLILVLCLPLELKLPVPVRVSTLLILSAGMLATQSRGAILGASIGALIWFFAPRPASRVKGRMRLLGLLAALGFALFAGYSVQQQLTAANAQTNSTGVRFDVEAATRQLWESSPLVGVGLRYFNNGHYGPFVVASNNVLNSEMAESGLVGTTGFVLLHVGTFVVLARRRRSALGTAALAVFAGQFLHGMVDIYWASGVTPLPFIIIGMALVEPLPLSDP